MLKQVVKFYVYLFPAFTGRAREGWSRLLCPLPSTFHHNWCKRRKLLGPFASMNMEVSDCYVSTSVSSCFPASFFLSFMRDHSDFFDTAAANPCVHWTQLHCFWVDWIPRMDSSDLLGSNLAFLDSIPANVSVTRRMDSVEVLLSKEDIITDRK